jgi:hypothetical protein
MHSLLMVYSYLDIPAMSQSEVMIVFCALLSQLCIFKHVTCIHTVIVSLFSSGVGSQCSCSIHILHPV